MKFSEVMQKYPDSAEIFMSFGLACAMCHAAAFETIEQGCKAHGMNDKQIKDLLKKLNEKVK